MLDCNSQLAKEPAKPIDDQTIANDEAYCPFCDSNFKIGEFCKCLDVSEPLIVGKDVEYWTHNSRMTLLEREIWNAAIEAAAECFNDNGEGAVHDVASEIRKLHK